MPLLNYRIIIQNYFIFLIFSVLSVYVNKIVCFVFPTVMLASAVIVTTDNLDFKNYSVYWNCGYCTHLGN